MKDNKEWLIACNKYSLVHKSWILLKDVVATKRSHWKYKMYKLKGL